MLGLSTTDKTKDLSDEELLARSASEPWLFAIILERYQDAFLRKARGIIHNEQDAEEIVQDAFTKIYMAASRFQPQPGARFSSWAYRILMNTAFTLYQKRLKEGSRFVNLNPEFEQFIADSSLHSGFREDKDRIERLLDKLPKHLAAVLRLHYLENWNHKDIAELNGESIGAIKARVHRAKAVLRNLVNES